MISDKTNKQIKQFKNTRVRISVRLKYIFFPIDGFKLIDIIRGAGYTLTTPPPYSPIMRGQTLGFSGPIARKGDNIIDASYDRDVLGVEGSSYDSAIKGFNEIQELIKINLQVDLNEVARFFEITALFELDTYNKPLETISQVFKDNDSIIKMGSILRQETSLFTIRLVPKHMVPNQEEWFDITIEPNIIRPTTTYDIYIVQRSSNRSKVEAFGNQLESNIIKIIDQIESF